jgi:hypothetical protein
MTTLKGHPLRFIIKSHKIVYTNRTLFRLLIKHIYNMIIEAKKLGDRCKKTVQVPFNNIKERFA